MLPLPTLHEATIEQLKSSKNLLAFSGGGDSTALFFLLLNNAIPFDIALVNYKTREQSDAEEAYAQELAKRYNKQCYILTSQIESNNFEHQAREVRYTFFEKLITEHSYQTLLSAHHLGDKLEWFLMQLTRGAGLVEMLGMSEWEERGFYSIVRPLLHINKKALLAYLHQRNILYFNDESNSSLKHLRNQFRHHYATPLLEAYEMGIAKSFAYLEEDSKRLLPHHVTRIHDLFIMPKDRDDLINIRHIDKILKILGLVASKEQRDEILRTKECVISGKIAICFTDQKIFIAPFLKEAMEKKFKEACRLEQIPAKIRPYLYALNINPCELRSDHTL